jgi:HAD superfamily hydrolase (TIGR02253 family)
MKIRAVVFDLDNTLLDFWGAKTTSINASINAMIRAGLNMNKKKAMKVLMDLYDVYGIEHKEILQKFLMKTQKKIDMKILSAGIVAYREIQAHYHKPYPNVADVMKELKKRKYKLGVISDAPLLKLWLRMTEARLTDYFDVVVSSEESGKTKPSSAPFVMALNKLKVRPEQVLYVGDNPRRDIKGAKNLGMKTALAEYGMNKSYKKHIKKNKADHVLKDITDLLKIVQTRQT